MAQANLIQTSVSGRTLNALAAQGDGLLMPKLSSADRNALALTTADAGLSVWDTTANAIYVWTGTAWYTPGGGSYTDGLWLALFVSAGGSITINPAFKTGKWAQIGNVVIATMYARVQAVAGPTGLMRLTGLPLPVTAGYEASVAVTANNLQNPAKTQIMGYATGLDINLYHYENGNLNPLSPHVQAGSEFWFSATYIV